MYLFIYKEIKKEKESRVRCEPATLHTQLLHASRACSPLDYRVNHTNKRVNGRSDEFVLAA